MVAVAILGVTARAYCYKADVADISGSKYFPAVRQELAKARKSVSLVMYMIELSSNEDAKVNQLVEELIKAKRRGVDVEVIVDKDIGTATFGWEAKIRSTQAYKRLREANIKAYYDEPGKFMHSKAIVIDKEIVILGSANWTLAALERNIETNVLIKSKELAKDILNYIETIKKGEGVEEYLDPLGEFTAVNEDFLVSPGLAPLMVKKHDERAFDIYLYLLWKAGADKSELELSYEGLAKYLGIYEGWNATDYRRQIIKALRRLEQGYKLIKFKGQHGKDGIVTLLKSGESSKEMVAVPIYYFDSGWSRNLSLRAKFCYLINLYYSKRSGMAPFWSKSVPTITKQFGGVYHGVISQGMDELRRKRLIEVDYDVLTGKPYDKRRPKMYKALRLYDLKKLDSEIKGVEEKYGIEKFAKARRYAGIVFEENNPAVIEDIILKTEEYGRDKVRKAFNIAGLKSTDNPKRTYRYTVGVIEGLR